MNLLVFLDENDVMKAPHPRYSPGLAPSDSLLFGHVKQLLPGAEFPDRDLLFDAIVQILTRREKVTLNDAVLSWVDRLRSCAAGHRHCIGQTVFY
jgi:hypothetical protein